MKHRILFSLLCLLACFGIGRAQEAPTLTHVLTLQVELGQAYSVGTTPHGERNVVPITGGTFEGPDMKGTILPGGADWQMTNKELGRTEIEAIYSIRTDDGVNIHIRNQGIISMDKDADGKPQFYFRCAPKFEAPADSKYAWLNNSLFLCAPAFGGPQGTFTLKVWKVN